MTFYNMLSNILNTTTIRARRSNWNNSFITREFNQRTKKIEVVLYMKYSFSDDYIKSLYIPMNEDLVAEDWEVETIG